MGNPIWNYLSSAHERLRRRIVPDLETPDFSTEKVDSPNVVNKKRRCEKAQTIVDHIVGAHSTLCKLPNLQPGPIINETLTNLVNLCIQIHEPEITRQILEDEDVKSILPSLRQICAEAECCLEAHWADRVLESQDGDEDDPEQTLAQLKSFPYFQNYIDLTRIELAAVCSVGATLPKKVGFIGSGPLPLTSLCLLDALKDPNRYLFQSNVDEARGATTANTTNSGVTILNIDRNPQAIDASSKLSARLGERGRGMEFQSAEAGSETHDFTDFDVVYLAALVGQCQEQKEELLISLTKRMRPGALLVVRTSWGLRSVLYPEVNLASEGLSPFLDITSVVHPYNDVVNSVIVAKIKRAAV